MYSKDSVKDLKRKIDSIQRKGKNDEERIEMIFDYVFGTSFAKSSTREKINKTKGA